QLAFARVAAVRLVAGRQPLLLRTPVNIFLGLPDIGATASEAEGFEAHRLKRAVASQDHQVGPRDLVAILLLDRPQQAAGLIEVAVIGPTVEWGEALAASAAAATTISRAIRACAVPSH